MKLHKPATADVMYIFYGWLILMAVFVIGGLMVAFLPESLIAIPLSGVAWVIGRRMLK